MLKGPIPKGFEIDHIDHNSLNNRIENLRLVSSRENSMNLPLPKHNTSGRVGITWAKREKKWQAQIGLDYKTIILGHFDKFEDAVAAREAAEKKYGFHPNHGKMIQSIAA